MTLPTAVMLMSGVLVRCTAPYWMGAAGSIKPIPPSVIRQNGQGEDVVAGYSSFEWTWEELTVTDYRWWTQGILGNAASATMGVRLYNYDGVLTDYSNAVVHRPSYERIAGDVFYNVKLVIDQILV